MAQGALEKARTELKTLIEAARTGAIIPIRLTGQLEALDALLAQAEEDQKKAAQSSTLSPGMEEFMRQQGEFISVAVHELRTPMTSIRGYADMLNTPSMGELTDMQKQFLDTIRTNAKRMESLLTDVSFINRLRAGTLKVNPKMDMFKNIAQMVERDMQPAADELKRKLIFDIPQGLPLLNIDGDHLKTALNKLVENALRYSAEGSEVVVSASGDGNQLKIIVKDSGIGITPEDLAKLGTLYFRAENDTVRSYKGSGLGIPIAYGMVKLLGGTIAVKSEPEKGTEFTIVLPAMS